jgi:hypothetical protein
MPQIRLAIRIHKGSEALLLAASIYHVLTEHMDRRSSVLALQLSATLCYSPWLNIT